MKLSISATGVGLRGNATLPHCEELLQNFTSNRIVLVIGRAGIKPLPMIGVGELKTLNTSEPQAVFTQLREIRRQALLTLPGRSTRQWTPRIESWKLKRNKATEKALTGVKTS